MNTLGIAGIGDAAISRLDADVLVIGGGPAGTWAAITAASEGARVILADKGYCGTSGVAATAGVGHWMVPPDPALREAAMMERARLAQQHRILSGGLDHTWTGIDPMLPLVHGERLAS